MAIRFSCEECGRAYSYKNKQKGHKFDCRDCSSPLIVPDNVSAPAESRSGPSKRKKNASKAQQKKKSLGKLKGVHTGFSLILWSLVVQLFGVLILSLASSLNPTLIIPALILVLIGFASGLLGKWQCLTAPKESGMGNLTGISIFLDLLGVLLAIGSLVDLPPVMDPLFKW